MADGARNAFSPPRNSLAEMRGGLDYFPGKARKALKYCRLQGGGKMAGSEAVRAQLLALVGAWRNAVLNVGARVLHIGD